MTNSANSGEDANLSSSHSSLDRLGEEIMTIWEDRVRSEISSSADILQPALRDALPEFLKQLALALSEDSSRGLIEAGSEIVRGHAGDRARETEYSPRQIVQELQVLKETVLSSLEKETTLSPNDYETIQRTFDQATQETLIEFFLVHAKLREQFMNTLSHDLRNPIGIARMGADVIKEIAQTIQDPDIKKDLSGLADRIGRNMKRADRMIQDLLDASILRVGEKLPLNISKCDVLAIVNETVSELDEVVQERVKIIGTSYRGQWDCDGLKRAIENLIKNAIKYGSADTPITIRIAHLDRRIKVSVNNLGTPIPKDDQKMIFHLFSRSKTAIRSGQQGWGLGLSLVRAVSEAMGGRVDLESTQEAGTTFTIDLPENVKPAETPSLH